MPLTVFLVNDGPVNKDSNHPWANSSERIRVKVHENVADRIDKIKSLMHDSDDPKIIVVHFHFPDENRSSSDNPEFWENQLKDGLDKTRSAAIVLANGESDWFKFPDSQLTDEEYFKQVESLLQDYASKILDEKEFQVIHKSVVGLMEKLDWIPRAYCENTPEWLKNPTHLSDRLLDLLVPKSVLSDDVFRIRAIAIDEERDYALLNAYAMFRLGFDTRIACSYKDLEDVKDFEPIIVVTDLAFAPGDAERGSYEDAPAQAASLKFRHTNWLYHQSSITKSSLTIVASGDESSIQKAEILESLDKITDISQAMPKPHPGIHGFYRYLFESDDVVQPIHRSGQSEDETTRLLTNVKKRLSNFFADWSDYPPSELFRDTCKVKGALFGPSSDFKRETLLACDSVMSPAKFNALELAKVMKLQLIAQEEFIAAVSSPKVHAAPPFVFSCAADLLKNTLSEKYANANTVELWLDVAANALKAKRMLCGRTPTLGLEALTLQYEAEVRAECLFIGVDQAPALMDRLAELDFELAAICCNFGGTSRWRSFFSAKVTILDKLKKIYDENGRYEEKQLCADQIREAKRKHTTCDGKSMWAFWRWPRAYFESLLSYPRIFALVVILSFLIAGWVFGITYYDRFSLGLSWNFDLTSFFRYIFLNDTDPIKKRIDSPFVSQGALFVALVVLPIFWWVHLGALVSLMTSRRQRS